MSAHVDPRRRRRDDAAATSASTSGFQSVRTRPVVQQLDENDEDAVIPIQVANAALDNSAAPPKRPNTNKSPVQSLDTSLNRRRIATAMPPLLNSAESSDGSDQASDARATVASDNNSLANRLMDAFRNPAPKRTTTTATQSSSMSRSPAYSVRTRPVVAARAAPPAVRTRAGLLQAVDDESGGGAIVVHRVDDADGTDKVPAFKPYSHWTGLSPQVDRFLGATGAQAEAIARESRAPNAPPLPNSVARALVGWRQMEVYDDAALERTKWFQFLLFVAGYLTWLPDKLMVKAPYVRHDVPTEQRESLANDMAAAYNNYRDDGGAAAARTRPAAVTQAAGEAATAITQALAMQTKATEQAMEVTRLQVELAADAREHAAKKKEMEARRDRATSRIEELEDGNSDDEAALTKAKTEQTRAQSELAKLESASHRRKVANDELQQAAFHAEQAALRAQQAASAALLKAAAADKASNESIKKPTLFDWSTKTAIPNVRQKAGYGELMEALHDELWLEKSPADRMEEWRRGMRRLMGAELRHDDSWLHSPAVTGVVKIHPMVMSARAEAYAEMMAGPASHLSGAQETELVKSNAVRHLYAQAVAAFIDRNQYLAGRHSQAVVDYTRKVARIRESLARFASVRFDAQSRTFSTGHPPLEDASLNLVYSFGGSRQKNDSRPALPAATASSTILSALTAKAVCEAQTPESDRELVARWLQPDY